MIFSAYYATIVTERFFTKQNRMQTYRNSKFLHSDKNLKCQGETCLMEIKMNLNSCEAEKIDFNPFEKIGREWMLISAYDPARTGTTESEKRKYNTMTASWGGAGVLWGKNVIFGFIRPQRYTKELIDAPGGVGVSFSFFDEKYRPALALCGKRSGRDCDKIAKAGLTPKVIDGTLFFEEAKLTITAKKLYAQQLSADSFIDKHILSECYPENDLHTMYVCEITGIYGV